MSPDPLSELQPIILGQAPGLWPLALGWWLVIIAVLLTIFFAVRAFLNYRKFWTVKRQCLTQIKLTTDNHQINRLLKQAALHYYPVTDVARLSGQAWADFLNLSLASSQHTPCNEACLALYSQPSGQDPVFQAIAQHWLGCLSRATINNATVNNNGTVKNV